MIRKPRRRLRITVSQVAVVIATLLIWEFLPLVPWIRENTFFDPFIISSPSRVAVKLFQFSTGAEGSVVMWPYVWATLSAAILGLVIGMVLGMLAGLLLSGSEYLASVFRPFLVALNAIPRIAIVPVVILLVGPGYVAGAFVSITVVFFVAFFNAYEGGRTVSPQYIDNARVMGATPTQIMRRVRLPYAFAWSAASLPLAAAYSLLVVVTTEILAGSTGVGRLLSIATVSIDSTSTFALVVVLSVLGVLVVAGTDALERKILHWWGRD